MRFEKDSYCPPCENESPCCCHICEVFNARASEMPTNRNSAMMYKYTLIIADVGSRTEASQRVECEGCGQA